MTLTGIKKHVKVLENAGLVTTEKVGRVRNAKLGARRLEDESEWIAPYTEPDLLAQWWGRGNKVVIERFEPERGGHWRFVEHSDGGTHGSEGRFREVTPMARIVQTFEWDGMPGHVVVDSISFEDLGDNRTKILVTSIFHTAEERDGMLNSGMEQGMNESYAALDRLLAGDAVKADA